VAAVHRTRVCPIVVASLHVVPFRGRASNSLAAAQPVVGRIVAAAERASGSTGTDPAARTVSRSRPRRRVHPGAVGGWRARAGGLLRTGSLRDLPAPSTACDPSTVQSRGRDGRPGSRSRRTARRRPSGRCGARSTESHRARSRAADRSREAGQRTCVERSGGPFHHRSKAFSHRAAPGRPRPPTRSRPSRRPARG
jgi:hypothetical protein